MSSRGDVEPEVAEAVDVEHGRDAARRPATVGAGQVEAHERRRVDLVAEIVEVRAGREMRGDRREEVARVERPRDVLEVVARVRQAARRLDAVAVGGEHQQAVVGPDEDAARRPSGSRRRGGSLPTPGIDDREMDAPAAGTEPRERARARPACTACGAIPCVTSMICASRRDPLHHAAADADEVVLQPEVGQERDVVEHG